MQPDPQLPARLLALRDVIVPPREDDGTPATLVALMPCEPAIGEVAVVAWTDSDGGELLELVRLDGGARVDDAVALRESLTLLAMVETVEELASFEELASLETDLRAFPGEAVVDLDELFVRAHERALESVTGLRALEPADDAPRMARPQRLDELGAALRELERAWQSLEQAADIWSEAHLAAHDRSDDAVALVQSLWRTMSIARRGPLARQVATALHEAREAGIAMAAAVTGAAPAPGA